jgi:glutaredoxin
MKARWAAALAGVAIVGTADAQYRWRDAGGQVNYGDFPPTEALDVQRVDGRAIVTAPDPNATLPFELRRAMAQHPVRLYSSADCAPCDKARALLARRGVPYAERTINAPEDAEELRRLTGTDKVPVLMVGRVQLDGFNQVAWTRTLDYTGYPGQSQLPPGYTGEPSQPLVARASGLAGRNGPAPVAR